MSEAKSTESTESQRKSEPLLSVRDLTVRHRREGKEAEVVSGLSFDLFPGEALAIAGESGSGKTQAFLAALGLLDPGGKATGQALYRGRDLLAMNRRELDSLRGGDIAMIFQDPMTALNPSMRLETQLTEGPRRRRKWTRGEARKRAQATLELAGVPDAARRLSAYPHELSGGLRQRAAIAMALLCEPKVLIADEPTTALDATVQAQILSLLSELREKFSLALALITHDLAVVAGLCDRMMVMYNGRAAEIGPVADVFASPRHPYTAGLLASTPRLESARPGAQLPAIPGHPPEPGKSGPGCAFAPRCPFATARCESERPALSPRESGRFAACHFGGDMSPASFHSQAAGNGFVSQSDSDSQNASGS